MNWAKSYIIKLVLSVILFFSSEISFSQTSDSVTIRKIFDEALENGKAYEWLDYLSNNIGGRLSGSPQAAQAVKWSETVFKSMGVTVIKQQCMVPHWVRGPKEKAFIVEGNTKTEVPICAIGQSIGTPKQGLTAGVVEIRNWDELKTIGEKGLLTDKIAFFNFKWNQKNIRTFHSYGDAVGPRWSGAQRAAPYGAIGVVVRSAGSSLDDYPHTGSMGYIDSIKKIPACAISTNGAELLSRKLMLKKGVPVNFSFTQLCELLPDTPSFNVIGEIKGSEFPDEIIVVGGHLDAWDNGHGAHDDGAGCVQSMEVLNLFLKLGIKPKRTVRAVLFMNEENGGRGGAKYAELAKQNNENNIAAIESDAGGFTPHGFGASGDSLKVEKILAWGKLFSDYGLWNWDKNGGGADIGHLADQGTIQIGLHPDSQRYFDYHHTAQDTFDKVNRRELELGAASMAALVYLLSEYGLK